VERHVHPTCPLLVPAFAQLLIALYRQGRLPVDRLLGQAFTLDRINEGFNHLASGSGLRDCIVLVDRTRSSQQR